MLSVIVAWRAGDKRREEALNNTLACLKNQSAEHEIIVVDQSLDSSLIFDETIRHVKLPPRENFNKSWCFNVGARQAKTDKLVFLDAEMIFEKNFLSEVRGFADKHDAFLCWDTILMMPGRDNPLPRILKPVILKTLGGSFFFNRETYFNKLGGMNENYEGYGCEDNDALDRCINLFDGRKIDVMQYALVHQYHDWEPIDNDLYKKNQEILRLVRKDLRGFTKQLREANLGNPLHPILINV